MVLVSGGEFLSNMVPEVPMSLEVTVGMYKARDLVYWFTGLLVELKVKLK